MAEMQEVDDLPCPFTRLALLAARAGGAERLTI